MKMLRDVDELVKAGMDLDEPRDNQGATLLHIASANGYIKVVEYLLEHRASTDVVDHDMWQPVHAAACWGHLEVLELLVQYGADLNVRNKHDETPADICEEGELRARILRLAADQEELRRHAAADRLRTARRSSSSASTSRYYLLPLFITSSFKYMAEVSYKLYYTTSLCGLIALLAIHPDYVHQVTP
ncbi:hypothetical protein HF086_005106 [Spodoptera exigua]|uniref:Protein phosphatase 1 regulatory subunit 16A n=1 Tax=Spodoptera exigua TaxID=7107 RepID=A0A922SL02_SPOEX|nr:hypothetical protein HF086_005106 [Spodoptera exigua]